MNEVIKSDGTFVTTPTHRAEIRTPDQRIRIFVSSTLQELAPERVAIQKVVRRLGMTPVFFEIGARPYPPKELYRAYLQQSDIFIGVYWEKYGWVAPDMSISGLEDEYRLSQHMPRLMYIKSSSQRDPKLETMIAEMSNAGLSFKEFQTATELEELVMNDLAILLTEKFIASQKRSHSFESHESAVPFPLTPLLGRDAELESILTIVKQPGISLLTLTGPGGVGKSRLAIEAAHRLGGYFGDGVHYVRLAAVDESSAVSTAIARALYPDEAVGNAPLQLLASRIADKKMLLVLDNFEQVIDAGADVCILLEACPNLLCLITSRESLHAAGEYELPVRPLPVLHADQNVSAQHELKRAGGNAAVQLFVQRAEAVKHDFVLDESNVFSVVHLCEALEGLPLAIELAAARIRMFTPNALVGLLDRKLDVLTSNLKDLPKRHQTLRATIEWSYRLLDHDEQALLMQAAVFSGGFNLETLHGMLHMPSKAWPFPRLGMFKSVPVPCSYDQSSGFLELGVKVESLVSKNIVYTRTDRNGKTRFMLYETIKDYALEQLEKTGLISKSRHAHLLFFLHAAETIRPLLYTQESVEWMTAMDEEQGNITAALTYALEHEPELGLRLAVAACEYWDTRANSVEPLWWLNELINAVEKNKVFEPKLCAIARMEMARLYFREVELEKLTAAVAHVEAYLKTHDDPYLELDVVNMQVMVAGFAGQQTDVETVFQKAIVKSREIGYDMQILNLQHSRAAAAVFSGHTVEGAALAKESVDMSKQIGAHRWTAVGLGILGFAQLFQSLATESAQTFGECFSICRHIGDKVIILYPMIGFAQVALLAGKAEQGVNLLGGIRRFTEQPGITPVKGVNQLIEMIAAQAKQALGDDVFNNWYGQGYNLQYEQTLDLTSSIMESLAEPVGGLGTEAGTQKALVEQ